MNRAKKVEYRFFYLKHLLLLIAFSCFSFHTLFSQQKTETGLPYIQNYSPNDYGAFDQNWGAIQDSIGVLYFANGDGVLSYDGVTWGLLELPNKASVFSLAINAEDEIYVGGGNELGYLESDFQGRLNYVSLLQKLPKEYHDFGQIRTICFFDNVVFFSSKKYILKWDGAHFEAYENSGDSFLFIANSRLLRVKEQGLTEFKNNKFELIPNGEFFSDKQIFSILPINEVDYLLVGRNAIYVYNDKSIVNFEINASDFFVDNILYKGIKLNDGTFALGSLKKGILIFDAEGNQKNLINRQTGIRSNCILELFQDHSGILWGSLNSGISKIEVVSPFSFFNKTNNAPEMVFDFQRFNGVFYAGGPEGLFSLKTNNSHNKFERLLKDFGMVWDLLLFEEVMLVGGGSGIYELNYFGGSRKIFNEVASCLHRSKVNPNRVFIANDDGIKSMYFENDKWTLEKKIEGVYHTVASILETKKGDLWLGLDSNKVAKIAFEDQTTSELGNLEVQIFSPENGLPDDIGKLYMIKDSLYFSSDNKVFKYSDEPEGFKEDKKLFASLGFDNRNVKINSVDENGVWLIESHDAERQDQFLAVLQKDGTFKLNKFEEGRVMHLRGNGLYAELKNQVIWYKGKPGILRHDLNGKWPFKSVNSTARISQVLSNNDSLLFGGYKSSVVSKIPFKNNILRFQYASPSFYDESKNKFQYILEGFDEDWSTWSLETKKDYTNIPGGNYTFKVRSKNVFNQISKEDIYSFTILSPWYATWWFYLISALGVLVLIVLIIQWRSKELKRKNEILETIIKERTIEIRHKNELLQHQTEKLMELDEAKTRLYSNITHEFRTPLTVILGMTETLKVNCQNDAFTETKKLLNMIGRNGKKLLQLVNELLDLAKIESGAMALNLVQIDSVPFVKYLSESFHSLAESKKINLTVYSEIDSMLMDVDTSKMASIISNLLSNAIKFSLKNGKIIVHLNKLKVENNLYFVIKVQDNGLGLSKEAMVHLFDRFYQAHNRNTNGQNGTGIGLSLTKEFVELMHGTITVESTLGKGSTFVVQIPVTTNAAKLSEVKTTLKPAKVSSLIGANKTFSMTESSTLPLVLIIEDNIDVAYYLKICLANSYTIIHALDGAIGIDMAFEHLPDIIISDVLMPNKDGFEVCATLKTDERTDHIPIILLTAKVASEDRLTGLAHGADAYLAKPFNQTELFTRLDQLVLVRKKLIQKLEKTGFSSFLKEREVSPQTKFLQEVIKIIYENLDNVNFGPSQLAKTMCRSESQIYRKLKSITNRSTALFIRSVRLQKAKELIQTSNKTISEIAYEVGFNDPSWFSRAFKEEFGHSPNETNK